MLPRKTPSAASPSPISSGWWWLRSRRGPLRVLTRFGTFGRSRDFRFFRATERSSASRAGLLLAVALAVARDLRGEDAERGRAAEPEHRSQHVQELQPVVESRRDRRQVGASTFKARSGSAQRAGTDRASAGS